MRIDEVEFVVALVEKDGWVDFSVSVEGTEQVAVNEAMSGLTVCQCAEGETGSRVSRKGHEESRSAEAMTLHGIEEEEAA